MVFRDRSGRCIPSWDTPEGAFDGWRERSRGRPCDYSAMAYDALRGGSGIQWPCTDDALGGTERIHTDHVFNTFTDYCETYGHDLLTGAAVDSTGHSALRLDGKAQLKGAPWTPGPGQPDEEYPLVLSTGRTAFHFHTRTRTPHPHPHPHQDDAGTRAAGCGTRRVGRDQPRGRRPPRHRRG